MIQGCHSYEIMYGMFLFPLKERIRRLNRKVRFLEIGLGCGQPYGPVASLKIWKRIFGDESRLDLWVAEFNEICLQNHAQKLNKVHVLRGDQSNLTILNDWVKKSGGNFDVIIDDGGHKSIQILNSLTHLWGGLSPGGIYFIEDLHVQSTHNLFKSQGYPAPIIVIQAWIEALAVKNQKVDQHFNEILQRFPLPNGLQWIFCQREACVLGK